MDHPAICTMKITTLLHRYKVYIHLNHLDSGLNRLDSQVVETQLLEVVMH